MPKSKRDKTISLTKTSKKGKLLKEQLVENVRNWCTKYKHILLLSVQNMRNNKLKDLRSEWNDSRFFFAKNKVMAIALGKTKEKEILEGVHVLSNALVGQCGLLFTNRKTKEALKAIRQYEEVDYARSGFVPSETIVLPEGPLSEFPHSIEPHLRQLGMPTALEKGVVTLIKQFTVCKQGEPLTPEQARILKLLGKPLATFKLIPLGIYSTKKGYRKLLYEDDAKENAVEKMEVDDETVTK
ncbi:PREDICTED: mRNA turnover protein 4 homolog [Polistes dominula]|uniref:Ribosome assembly factor mrt4 n=1 Tax=Polistes dominula TaxID=743375 RepID=A0ABM1J2C1_POLDO|nr:PREDICTED: mRNA turnover protein 4 homolog [Polistes dominula]